VNTLTVGLLTLVAGTIYALILDSWDHSRRFQGSPFTIVQVAVGMLIILAGVALAVFTDSVATAREAFWTLLACIVAVGLPIAVWYVGSYDRHMSEID